MDFISWFDIKSLQSFYWRFIGHSLVFIGRTVSQGTSTSLCGGSAMELISFRPTGTS